MFSRFLVFPGFVSNCLERFKTVSDRHSDGMKKFRAEGKDKEA